MTDLVLDFAGTFQYIFRTRGSFKYTEGYPWYIKVVPKLTMTNQRYLLVCVLQIGYFYIKFNNNLIMLW